MDTNKLISNSQNITYDKGYIAFWCKDYELPETFNVNGETLLRKDHFHVSLLCVKNILLNAPELENQILQHFCDYIRDNEIKFEGFTKEFRLAKKDERLSVVALCKMSNLNKFTEYLSEKIDIKIPIQPTHVTIYTLQPNAGIGLNSPEEMEQGSEPVAVPETILVPLMGYKKIIVVDEHDTVIGAEHMMEAMKKGLIRRAARVYVFNESGQLLIQQRSEKVMKPLLLDQSAAGHVDIGETYEQAAYRELKEELGLDGLKLTLVETSYRTTNFYNAIYKVVIPDDAEINFDPGELKQVIWYNIEDLDREIKASPEIFNPSFIEIWSAIGGKICRT
jgi:isopentenyldiphosphate isomerase